ncbi:hypothetical protein FQN52_004299 [Onygenales sp. PD_12]|nr:hypothetical protein FQN52_004299 [Onygenales sp. PD_12]KAK2784598.1 hypothetical protein FQN53_008425 [Emmonsiellopsis sp. PD_33]
MSEAPAKPVETGESRDTPFPEAPDPWMNLKAEFFGCVGRAKSLPSGSYADLEAQSAFADPAASGEFRGVGASVMIVRYTETPVGPYDEIVWIPGYFDVPKKGIKKPRVTRIYVSNKDTIYNGRKNWNIPKHFAVFKFTPSDKPSIIPYSRLEVSLPSTPDQPFISIELSPVPVLSRPTLPISTSYLPIDLGMWLPPNPESKDWKEDGMVGTTKWCHCEVGVSGWGRVMHVKGDLGDGRSFPKLDIPNYWVYVREAKLTCKTVWSGEL